MTLQTMLLCVIGYFAAALLLACFVPTRVARAVFGLALAAWLAAVLALTILTRVPVLETRVHLTPFDRSAQHWLYGMLENAVLFLPWGCAAMGLWPRLKALPCAVLGAAISLCVELLQLATHRGICDIDDFIANTLGTILGVCAAVLVRRLAARRAAR